MTDLSTLDMANAEECFHQSRYALERAMTTIIVTYPNFTSRRALLTQPSTKWKILTRRKLAQSEQTTFIGMT
ncbi:hypothetical protein DMENIID0001_055850 [Sergentomyia squamirostris]